MNYVLLCILLTDVYALGAGTRRLKQKALTFINNNTFPVFSRFCSCAEGQTTSFDFEESPSKKIANHNFFNLDAGAKTSEGIVTEKDKNRWASFELRRFTYKLGRYNKKLRKVSSEIKARLERGLQVKGRRKSIYTNFDVDEEELRRLNLESHKLTKQIETFRRFRRLFSNFIKGLRANTNPRAPYVPQRLRSDRVSAKYYSIAPKPRPRRVKKVESGSVGPEKADSRESTPKTDKDGIPDLLKLISEVKGRRYHKGKIY